MIKVLLLLVALFTLSGAGCVTTGSPLIVNKSVLVEIPEDFLVCMQVHYPNATTLTDKQVAKLIVELSSANAKCHLNMAAIKKLQDMARKRLKGKS